MIFNRKFGAPGLQRKKLAIISTYNENCGNASYTHVLKVAFSEIFDVDVIPLDLFLLQKPQPFINIHADAHIKSICAKLKNYDYVNIQFEAGLYGATAGAILRRMKWLIDAAPNLILTMHRVDVAETTSLLEAIGKSVRALRAGPLFHHFRNKEFSVLYHNIVLHCKEQSARKNVWIKVHAKREHRVIRDVFRFKNVIHYPLAFLNKEEQKKVKALPKADLAARFGLPQGSKLFGVFGYISNYKGIETAIKTVAQLPTDWHLVIAGSQHPQSIKAYKDVDPYLESILNLIANEDAERERKLAKLARVNHYLEKTEVVDERLTKPITDRIKFIGSLDDDDFVHVLRDIDAVVLPYIEVGQSMSGVIVLAMEAGGRVLGANNLSFAETRKYFGDTFERFDIGNHIELAQRLQAEPLEVEAARTAIFETYNIRNSVALQAQVFEGTYKNV